MAAMFRSGASRRKGEAPGKIRIQLKGSNSKILHSDDDDNVVMDVDKDDDDEDVRPSTADNGIPDDLPEGTIIVQPEAVEDAPVKKKRDPPVRIDTSVLDNVSCTACGRQLNPYKGSALQKHPELKVVICKRCEKFLSSGDIAKDKDGADEQCRWCGEGGRLVVCDECASAFCKACVMRNFNRSEFNSINSHPNWKCYLCNKAPLQGLRENYRKIRDTLKALQARDKAKAAAASSAAPTSNGTLSSDSAPKGGDRQSSASASTQGKNAAASSAAAVRGSKQASSISQKSNSESLHRPHVGGKTITGCENSELTLSLADLNVHYENVDAVMDKLSTATSTFKEMLRALRSQFHATSPRALDEAPPPFQFSFSSSMDIQEKRKRCAKALNMGLETYVKSLKTILSGSAEVVPLRDDTSKVSRTNLESLPAAKTTASSSDTSKTSVSANLISKSTTMPKGASSSADSNGGMTSEEKVSALSVKRSSRLASNASRGSVEDSSRDSGSNRMETSKDTSKGRGKKNSGSIKEKPVEVEEEFIRENSSGKSPSEKDSTKAKDNISAIDKPSKEVNQKSATEQDSAKDGSRSKVRKGSIENSKSGKDSAISSTKDLIANSESDVNDNEKSDTAKDSVRDKDGKELGLRKPGTRLSARTNDSTEETGGSKTTRNRKAVSARETSKNSTEKADSVSYETQEDAQRPETAISGPDSNSSSVGKSVETKGKDKTTSLSRDHTSADNDENMAAKFDLIKELADEMLRDDEEESDGSDEDGLLTITFGDSASANQGNDDTADNGFQSSSKRRKGDSSSDEMEGFSAKRAKQQNSDESSENEAESNTKQVKGEGETNKAKAKGKTPKKEDKKHDTEEVTTVSDVSSSDLLMSDDSDAERPARKQRKKRKEMPKPPAEKTARVGRPRKAPAKAEEKSQAGTKSKAKSLVSSSSDVKVNGKDAKSDVDELDKEIDKLSKLPTMRKRKAVNTNEDKEEPEEDEEKEMLKPGRKTAKKSKPGPKSSKKNTDYDDLSSDGDEKKDSEDEVYDDDDEDEPPVTFFIDAESIGDKKDSSVDDENERAKNGLLEDMDSDEDDDDDNDNSDDMSSAEDSDSTKKTKSKKKDTKAVAKKKEKDSKEKEADAKDEDSDDNIGKRKPIRSKLLDAKLSDSDSDIGKPKKKKKSSDEESFKAAASSDSSIESDLTDDDDDSEKDSEEEEEEDGDEPKSKKKRKRKARKRKGKGKKKGGDDEEEEDQEEEGGKKKGKGKRRRRIKKMANSSDEDGEDDDEDENDDDPNSSKAGKRKQIRKVMSNKKLEDSTKAAAKAEEKRRKRIAAKQREFNIETITDENNPMNCPITTKLILEASKEEGEDPVIQVNKSLVRKLKPHQVEAVQFMWDCMYESVKRSKREEGAGCILAHCMGLGKTLSVIAFVHTVLTHQNLLKHKTCLVVSPLNTVLNWKNEWSMWLDEEDQLEVWELASCKQNIARADCLKEWHEEGGIMIMGYEMYRNLTMGNRCKNKKQKKIFQDTLVDPGPDLVICDEGHILKNEASAISKAMNQMKTKRRVVLTGTPLQNNLNEYHCMVNFVKPNLLGTRREFNNRFISPIQNGQCTDSTPRDVKLMKARAHVLHEMLAGCVQRRDYSALTKFLPPKQEYVISVRLTNIQIELYEKYLELTGQGVDGIYTNKGARLFTDYQNLMKIWTHPWVLKLAEIRDEQKMKYDDEDSFIDDESDVERSFSSSESSSEEEKNFSDSGGEGTSSPRAGSPRASSQKGTRRTRAKARREAGEESDPEEVIAEWKSKTRSGKADDPDMLLPEPDRSVTKEWWAQFVTEDDKLKMELSNKLYLLFEILRMCEEIGDKVLIFSQSILSLNIIESFLEVVDSKFQQECENMPEEEEQKESFGRSWTKNLDYYRMDGSTSAQNRQMWAAAFNDLDNYRARLFLISTRAGGLGINLVAANRVIIFDASWNPSHDVQSIFRVYRFGQTKPCYIYRFLAQGTMEEKIYERQVTKLSLSQRVVDEHQIERHFSANDLKELYNFKPDRWDDGTEKPTLALPKDPLLAEILTSNKHCVVSFHEHDSLLENQVEQTLTEEEKKAAWEEYEQEKKGIIVRGPGMERTASWPMMAAAQILSREQITATVQALRQQLPDISEDLFHLHVQQALRRQVQLKQEEMRRMELLRMQEMTYLNMIKQDAEQSGMSSAQSMQAMQNMAPWLQIQRLRALQNQMMMGNHLGAGMHPSASMSLLGGGYNPLPAERISNRPEEAIDLDDN